MAWKVAVRLLHTIVVIAALGMTLPALAKAQATAPPFEQILNRLSSWGDLAHSWSVALPVAERYVVLADLNDEAVLDRNTGLVWQRTPNTVIPELTWSEARYHCLNTVIGGQKGWRLPLAAELTSLMEPSQAGPVLPDSSPFDAASLSKTFWSSTVYEEYQKPVFVVEFDTGLVRGNTRNDYYYTRCVRGGAHTDPTV